MIVDISPSTKINKRYEVTMDNGKKYNFGLKNGSTYIDHKDKIKKKNYWLRHMSNKKEKDLIENLIPSPALFSAILLWGPFPDLKKNVAYLNKLSREQSSRQDLKQAAGNCSVISVKYTL
jgi:hypothetical protein